MRRPATVSLVTIIILVAAGVAYVALHSSPVAAPTRTQTSEQTNGSSTVHSATVNAVSIENLSFSPAEITVKKGTTVTWTNNDNVGHTVTQDNGSTTSGPGLDSKVLNKGENYSATFDTVGTFKYHCSVHPHMTGTVTVTE